MAKKIIGGLGLCLKLAYDTIRPGTPALSPDNPIILGAGPLVGTNLLSSSRVFAVTKLPTSNTIGWCGAGGVNFGYLLKNAGYDHVIIEGKADHPVYLKIDNDQVEICDADSIWGKDVEDTDRILRQSVKNPPVLFPSVRPVKIRFRFPWLLLTKLPPWAEAGSGP